MREKKRRERTGGEERRSGGDAAGWTRDGNRPTRGIGLCVGALLVVVVTLGRSVQTWFIVGASRQLSKQLGTVACKLSK